MTDATATLYDVTSFDRRVFRLGDYRRVVHYVVIGLAIVAAACVLVTTVTVTAAWIVNTALATNPNLHAKAAIGPATISLANHYPTLASAVDYTGSARNSTGPADALTFEAKWARATAPAYTRTNAVALLSEDSFERASNVPSPPPSTLPLPSKLTSEWANSVPLPRPHPARHEIARSPVGQATPQVAAATPPPASTSETSVTLQQAHNKSMALPGPDSRTAVYDIAAHTVYLPNGNRLEAHSGLGDKLDDPRYVHVRMRGPTPPNVYDLTLREELFHGVRAIRLNPVGEDKMFGRDGMLAHTYMLGPNGQSNGCVSFKDYSKFLQAFLNGEVDRLVVVPNLGAEPSRIARARREPVGRYASNDR